MALGLGLGIQYNNNNVFVAFTTEYQAIIARATALGYTLPSPSVQAKQNAFLVALKSIGVWTKLDVFYCFAQDGSKEFATINWKAPSANQCTLINSPTWTSNQGFTGNGTSSYIDTNYQSLGAGNYTLNNASRYAYVRTLVANRIIDGVDSSTANSITTFVSANQRINQSGGNLSASFDYSTSGAGMKSIHRTSSTVVTCYNNTTASSGLTATSTGLVTSNQCILRSASGYGSHQISMYAMGASMISENSDFVSSFSTYLSSL
jgi:hypothetical protein